jgi:hypothetical protein
MIELIVSSITLGAWAWLYCSRLIEVGEVFSWVPDLVNWLFGYKWGAVFNPDKFGRVHYVVSKWIYLCPKCHAGFVGLWSYPLLFDWDLTNHLTYVILSMAIATILTEKYEYNN